MSRLEYFGVSHQRYQKVIQFMYNEQEYILFFYLNYLLRMILLNLYLLIFFYLHFKRINNFYFLFYSVQILWDIDNILNYILCIYYLVHEYVFLYLCNVNIHWFLFHVENIILLSHESAQTIIFSHLVICLILYFPRIFLSYRFNIGSLMLSTLSVRFLLFYLFFFLLSKW